MYNTNATHFYILDVYVSNTNSTKKIAKMDT
jgi:hypothetical protein